MHFHLIPLDQHVLIYCRGIIMRILVIILHTFLLTVAVVHKQRFSGGPLELFLPCVSFNVRGNTVGCARGLSTHATYNYAFSFYGGYCFQCRVIDTNVTATEEAPLRGPHLFSGEQFTIILQNLLTKLVRIYFSFMYVFKCGCQMTVTLHTLSFKNKKFNCLCISGWITLLRIRDWIHWFFLLKAMLLVA